VAVDATVVEDGSLQALNKAKACSLKAIAVVLENLFLTVIEAAQSSPLYGRDVDENISTAIVRLNEAKPLGRIDPFNSASSHFLPTWCKGAFED
jgi:hypothetical protein